MSASTPEDAAQTTEAPKPEPTTPPTTHETDVIGSSHHRIRTMRLSTDNVFGIAFLGTLGVLVALVLGGMVATSGMVITYIGAALFLALGLDPVVRLLCRTGMPRGVAVLVVFLFFVLAVVGVVLLLIPAINTQVDEAIQNTPVLVHVLTQQEWFQSINQQVDGAAAGWLDAAQRFASDPQNMLQVAGGLVTVGTGLANFIAATVIIVVLTLYFMVSLQGLKRGLISLLPASRRSRFTRLSDRIFDNVGKYVMSQTIIALINAVCAYIAMSILQVRFREVLAVVIFLFALLPLVGSLTAATLTTLMTVVTQVLANPENVNLWPALFIMIYYLIYMQFEAYVLTPHIVNRAVPIPGVIVVIAALLGGTLLGVFGALLSIPVAASVILLVQELWVPRQNKR
ncbi:MULTISPECIES: AI-2E family transporter [unclassified Pseudoclavibacter]|uniref:AI-2E family transporter n=1 Tax=unclassified Pseudoclavibacter TaxID=2615177 RepID=UPI0013010581|nr:MULTISPECIES: AI-2E family transporter [unclassified Pseudoclavibacter]KAB1658621.1 AI-2E family transporter [Pseudoclavibacter sp. CFCC 11306]KAB1661317.1 AI-2E family transporter [Pseudoclavibacter sp. CFCC 13796]